MKKLIYCAAALATALFAGSCQRELLDTAQSGSTVTFAVEIPEVATKAKVVDNGKNINNLVYAVYRTDATSKAEAVTSIDPAKLVYRVNPKANNEVTTFVEGKTNVTLELINNQKYIILFWAQVNQTWVTGTEFDLTNITYPSKLTANQNKYEAFCGAAFVDEVTGATKKSVTLTRPFAQINLASTDPANYDIDIVSSSVKIENVYPKFNVATKKAFGDEFRTVVYADNANPDGNFGNYDHHVAMNYIFANPKNDGTTPVKVTCTINTASHGTNIVKEVSNVPVAQNYRTNIVGNLLTSEAEYTVELNDVWGEPETNIELWDGKTVSIPTVSAENENVYVISHPNELAWLAAAVNGTLEEDYTRSTVAANDFLGKTFILTKDVDLANCEWSPIGSNGNIFKGTFDGQGHTVKNLVVNGEGKSDQGLFGYTTDGEIKNVTVENAKVSGRLNVGVVAGTPYTSKYTNITVKGHVEVNGMAYVGGVGGKNAYADWTDITVEVDETSYVKANSVENGTAYRTYVGGVVGFNGEGGHKFSNITSNINVEGTTCDVGGLFGIAHYGNQFENCSCTGKVTITTDEVENALEMGGIAGVWHNENGTQVTFTDCQFTGSLITPNITEEVNFYYGGLVGNSYNTTGTGKLIIDGKQYVATVAQLQAALDAATGETTLYLCCGIVGNVTVVQKQGVKITIDGEGHKFNGSIKVHSNSNHYADAELTIKNVNFETSVASLNFIEALENGAERYSTNITAEECTFTATGDAVNTAVGLQIKSSNNAKVHKCTSTNMHSMVQANSCNSNVEVKDCTINGKGGVSFTQVKEATVEGCTITASGYGIRYDGRVDNYGITVKNNNITAAQPFIARKMTGANNTITLEGTNTLITEAEYQIVITNGSDDEAYVKPTGTYTLTGADTYKVFPAPFPVASWDEFTAALEAGETDIKLTADITFDANYQLQNSVILNLGGYSMTLPMINIHTKTTIKNGTINGKVYARKNSEIVFNNVKFSGAVADNLSTEGHLAIQGGCKSLYAKDCLFSPTSVSGSQTKPLSFEGGSTIMKFENCEFKSSPYKKQVYFNPLSATGSLDFTNCNFNNKTPNIMFAAACPLTNVTMSGTTKLSSVTFEINRAKEAVTDADLAYLRTLIANNSFSSVRLFYAGGSSEYIR